MKHGSCDRTRFPTSSKVSFRVNRSHFSLTVEIRGFGQLRSFAHGSTGFLHSKDATIDITYLFLRVIQLYHIWLLSSQLNTICRVSPLKPDTIASPLESALRNNRSHISRHASTLPGVPILHCLRLAPTSLEIALDVQRRKTSGRE